MQKKRWIPLGSEIIEITDCDMCFAWAYLRSIEKSPCMASKYSRGGRFYIDDVPKEGIHEGCPLTEAESKEEAFQKIFKIFYDSYSLIEDDWNKFVDTFKGLVTAMGV